MSGTQLQIDALADDGVFGHDREVGTSNDVPVASGGHEDVGTGSSFLHGGNLVAGHSSLKSIDWVNLSDDDTSTIGLEGFCALRSRQFSAITIGEG